MNINIFLLLLFLHIEYTIAKLIGCSSLRTKIIELEDSNNKLKNYYRTIHNSSCIHCPEGFFSNEGYDCTKSSSNITNIHTLCLKCPLGSIVNRNSYTCTYTPCFIGYYEKNNTCVECPIRTYSDNIGMSICNVCNNKKSFAYMTSDSIFNSIFYNIEYISDNINHIAAKIYNHRKEIFDITCSIIIVYGLLLFFNK
jgi:hypothetical protein